MIMREPAPFHLHHPRYRTMTRQEEKDAFARLAEGDERAGDEIVRRNLKFVAAVARNYFGRGLTLGELMSEGTIGLRLAVDHFDRTSKHKFISYAVWWVRQRILKALAEQPRAITMPQRFMEASRRIDRARQRIEAERERPATLTELSEAAGLPMNRLTEALSVLSHSLSFDMPIADGEVTLADAIAGPENAGEAAEDYMVGKYVANLLDALHPTDRAILVRRFGLDGALPERLEDVGLRIGVTRERVRQREKKAMALVKRRAKQIKFRGALV